MGESSLYPALQRLLLNGWVTAEWGASENNRRARYYTLTPAGRKQLAAKRADFERMVAAIQRVLQTRLGGTHGKADPPPPILAFRGRATADLAEEMEFHRDMLAAEVPRPPLWAT